MKMLQHKFVEFIPHKIEEGILYISLDYCTAIHRCACGCGNEVVTPISPTDWKLSFNGKAISLHPSIGNWNFECQSHYWIKNNKVEYAGRWTKEEIDIGRVQDKNHKTQYFECDQSLSELPAKPIKTKARIWSTIANFFKLS